MSMYMHLCTVLACVCFHVVRLKQLFTRKNPRLPDSGRLGWITFVELNNAESYKNKPIYFPSCSPACHKYPESILPTKTPSISGADVFARHNVRYRTQISVPRASADLKDIFTPVMSRHISCLSSASSSTAAVSVEFGRR